MDKLNEPEFPRDKNWPRIFLGTQELRSKQDTKYTKVLLVFGGFSVFRYLREVTFYKKNYLQTAAFIPLFLLSSHWIAQNWAYDPYLIAAERNNEKERTYITKYKSLMREAKSKGLVVPDYLVY